MLPQGQDKDRHGFVLMMELQFESIFEEALKHEPEGRKVDRGTGLGDNVEARVVRPFWRADDRVFLNTVRHRDEHLQGDTWDLGSAAGQQPGLASLHGGRRVGGFDVSDFKSGPDGRRLALGRGGEHECQDLSGCEYPHESL